MSVWVVCPSKRPADQVNVWAEAWRERGYGVAILRDEIESNGIYPAVEFCYLQGPYLGYARSVNKLIRIVGGRDLSAEWFIAAGDDVFPDANHTAEEIAAECRDHFFQVECDRGPGAPQSIEAAETFGVMQPTGDRWQEDKNGSALIDRVCGSAWIGREFARRMYQGNGPFWPEYEHMFVDEHLQNVALKLGVLWQRRDLIHFHAHALRPTDGRRVANISELPEFLKPWNTKEHWDKSKAIFERQKAGGFAEAFDLLPE